MLRVFDSIFRTMRVRTSDRRRGARACVLNPRVSVELMIESKTIRGLDKGKLLRAFSRLVEQDRQNTAALVAYIAEIDRRKLYLEYAYSSMFAFCAERFRMSEAVAHRRIRAGRATSRFPLVLDMIARGELHLTRVHHLAAHLTEENHREVLQRAKHRSTREIQELVAELAPQPDVPSRIRALPRRKDSMPLFDTEVAKPGPSREAPARASVVSKSKPKARPVPLSPKRYKLQVTIGQETREKLDELQGLLSHQVPDGDLESILDRALDALLLEARKKKAAVTDKPRRASNKSNKKHRGIPAQVRRQVFERDEGACAFVDARGRRCVSKWRVEFHHRGPYARGGTHDPENIELRCRGHNQYEAELDFGTAFMERRRRAS